MVERWMYIHWVTIGGLHFTQAAVTVVTCAAAVLAVVVVAAVPFSTADIGSHSWN